MERTDLEFYAFGVGAFAEIVVLVLAILLDVHTIILAAVLAVGAIGALGALGLFMLESYVKMNVEITR